MSLSSSSAAHTINTLFKDAAKKISSVKKEKNLSHHIRAISKIQEKEEEHQVKRYALFPILDEKAYEFYQTQEVTHWSENELDFTSDRKHYDNAGPNEKKVFDLILAFFLIGDGVISRNIAFRFLLECSSYEEQAMFISQLHIELVHAATYGLAAFTFKRSPEAMAELIDVAQETACVKRKVDFMEKWIHADVPKWQRYVAFACSEGIFFCCLFAIVFWFRSKGKYPNFILANELIANDESLHRNFGCFLFNRDVDRILADATDRDATLAEIRATVEEIVHDAVMIEDDFSDYCLSESLEDLNALDLKKYTRLIADNLLCQLSFEKRYNETNPFTWLDDISMEQKGNFFEVRIGSYKKKSLSDVLNWKKRAGLEEGAVDSFANPEDVDF